MILVAANFRGKTFSNSLKRQLFLPYLEMMDKIFVDSDVDFKLGLEWGLKNLELASNPRIDQVLDRQEKIQDISWLKAWIGDKTLILASVWKTDMEIIESDVEKLISDKKFKVIIVPHEYEAFFDPKSTKFFYSTSKKFDPEASICMVNEVGILFDLFQFANFAYVGGGFNSDVHSTLEPASFGLPLFFGPNIKRSLEASDFVNGNGAKIINNKGDLFSAITQSKINGSFNLDYLKYKRGGSQKIIQYLKEKSLI